MPSSTRPHRVIGAYAAQPDTPQDLRAFYHEVLDFPGIDGLEISWGSPTWERDRPIIEHALTSRPHPGHHVVTLVGAEAGLAELLPGTGLAAADPRLRRAAVELVEQAWRWVRDVASPLGTIVAVELHSYPSVAPSFAAEAGDALTASLIEIGSWDWGSTEIIVEHCDARTEGRAWRKGLLPLDVEVAAVTAAAARSTTRLGCAINWGRSAIEGRDPSTPRQHVTRLRAAGLLRGLLFSGATDRDGAFGEAWSDAHPPFHEQLDASIMTRAEVEATLEAAGGDLLYDGTKIAVRPLDMPWNRRVEILREGLAMLPTRPQRAIW